MELAKERKKTKDVSIGVIVPETGGRINSKQNSMLSVASPFDIKDELMKKITDTAKQQSAIIYQ